jgi:transposase-like protein
MACDGPVRCSARRPVAKWARQHAANRDLGLDVKHRQHKGLSNRAENSHQPTRICAKVMRGSAVRSNSLSGV